MSCEGRFRAIEGGLGFPPVDNYAYLDNLPIRGVDDRTFRWDDVCIPSTWLFLEPTESGHFENFDNAYTGFSLHDDIHGLRSGLITSGFTGTSVEVTGFPGWTITGNATFYVSGSPLHFATGTGDINYWTGVTGAFNAFAIGGSGSIGLFCIDGGDGGGNHDPTNHPQIYSDALDVGIGAVGVMSGTERYQFYADAYCPYGGTGGLRVTIEGHASDGGADSGVAYFNAVSNSWTFDKTTAEFTHPVPTGKISNIVFDFNTTGFPGVSPTGYRIVVENTSTGNFIVVDDIHVDQYMAKNEFVDHTVATGYLVQITPDIGWHDTQAMFEDRGTGTNPHLVTLGPYSAETGLVDELDGSVSVTLSDQAFKDATYSPYRKYLWRALALSPNGCLGSPGFPVRFDYMGKILDEEFSITQIFDDPLSVVKVIIGTKTERMTVLVDETEHPNTEYPTKTSWKVTINLDKSYAKIGFRGLDKGGTKSSIQYVELTSQRHSLTENAVWNTFDEHGLLAHTPRLPHEDNISYRGRVQDAYATPGSVNFNGVVNGGSRELGLTTVEEALSLTIPRAEYNVPRHASLEFEVTSASVRVRSTNMVIEETLFVDPVYLTVDLSKLPKDVPKFLEMTDGSRAERDKITISELMEDSPTDYKFHIDDLRFGGKHVTVRYEYYEELLYKSYESLDGLLAALNALVDQAGTRLVIAALGPKIAGSESPMGLYLSYSVVLPKEGATIPWSPFYLRRVSDRMYRDYFKSSDGTYWNTKYYEYVKELKARTNVFWGHVEADRDYWDSADSTREGFDEIPTLFDPPMSRQTSILSGVEKGFDGERAWGRNDIGHTGENMVNRGFVSSHFIPGVAYKSDLVTTVFTTFSLSSQASAAASLVASVFNANSGIQLFTGQS